MPLVTDGQDCRNASCHVTIEDIRSVLRRFFGTLTDFNLKAGELLQSGGELFGDRMRVVVHGQTDGRVPGQGLGDAWVCPPHFCNKPI